MIEAAHRWREKGAAIARTRDGQAAIALGVIGLALWLVSRFRPSVVPFWLPWDFSTLWYAAFAFTGFCYVRGLRTVPTTRWRTVLFVAGMLAIWTVIQTRYEYLALHMFFYNRIQHMMMHHLGPFLIALAWPWPTIIAGMPAPARRVVEGRWARAAIRFARQPEVACIAFVGLLVLWLIPSVHLVAMLDPVLYQVMNWSMVIDGLLFWNLVLDPREPDEAGIGYVGRAAVGVVVMFPQIAIGATLCFAGRDLYPFYSWCGRLYAGISPISDQRIGGVVVWESPSMMSVAALILVLNAKRRFDEKQSDGTKAPGAISSAAWTGR